MSGRKFSTRAVHSICLLSELQKPVSAAEASAASFFSVAACKDSAALRSAACAMSPFRILLRDGLLRRLEKQHLHLGPCCQVDLKGA